ncbi:hypothetical protein [Winogradskyella ursingii]|uniref:hypothetical protein n=1 Tax=Winogradskyella ursingii TaxID=2686079 RepID=UPI0015CB490D|nr:hypothetical protein [Winogradskyella ursingii]
MRKIAFYLSLLALISHQSCISFGGGDDDIANHSNFEPVIMKRSNFETTTLVENAPRVIENSGKIYVKDNFIFINEVNKGFHLINNSDPSNPENIAFIKVLGSSDLSIKEDVFYANNATDLIAFKINETTETLLITKRIKNTFPQIMSPEGEISYNLEQDEIIIDWQPVN